MIHSGCEVISIPPISDELNNSVNFSDEEYTETKTCNELMFSDEVIRFRYTPHFR